MTKDDITGLIELMNREALLKFEKMNPSQKSKTILKDFISFHNFQDKFSRARNESDKDRYLFEQERMFIKGNKELSSLTEDELSVFFDILEEKIEETRSSKSDKDKLMFKLILGTIIRRLPKSYAQDSNNHKLEKLYDLAAVLDDDIVM